MVSRTLPLEQHPTRVELVRWSQRVGSEKKKVDAAKNIFNSAFGACALSRACILLLARVRGREVAAA